MATTPTTPETQALVPADPGGEVVAQVRSQQMSFDDLQRLGKLIASSGFFKDTKDLSQAVVKILAGAEIGIGPIQSMGGVYVVNGRTALMANLIGLKVKQAGYDYRVLRLDNDGCVIAFFNHRGEPIGESSFTKEDATKAGLTKNETYAKYPRNMYFARALTNGQRWFCPDAISGVVYVKEELDELSDAGAGAPEIQMPQRLAKPTTQNAPSNESAKQEVGTWRSLFTAEQQPDIIAWLKGAHKLTGDAAIDKFFADKWSAEPADAIEEAARWIEANKQGSLPV